MQQNGYSVAFSVEVHQCSLGKLWSLGLPLQKQVFLAGLIFVLSGVETQPLTEANSEGFLADS